jgi:hypothetical protein
MMCADHMLSASDLLQAAVSCRYAVETYLLMWVEAHRQHLVTKCKVSVALQ